MTSRLNMDKDYPACSIAGMTPFWNDYFRVDLVIFSGKSYIRFSKGE